MNSCGTALNLQQNYIYQRLTNRPAFTSTIFCTIVVPARKLLARLQKFIVYAAII